MKAFKILFLSIGLIYTSLANAKSFTNLSSARPISVSTSIKTEGYKTIHLLAFNKNKEYQTIPLKLTVIINKDTLTDYFELKEAINDDVKTLYLKENDDLVVELTVLANQEIDINKVKGNIKISEPLLIKTDSFKNQKSFIGNYWDKEHSTMFRVMNNNNNPQNLKLTIDFNQNYVYDKFYYQLNVLAPDSSFFSIEGVINVNTTEFLNFEEKLIEIPQPIAISQIGKYIIDIVPLMTDKKLNGIQSVSYSLTEASN